MLNYEGEEKNMKSILGFSINDRQLETTVGTVETDTTRPVRSLVQVRFANDGRVLTYYNDRFALEVGDTVFVDGKLAGKIGTIEKVTTKFKINLADYKRVISKADREIHGTYTEVMDKMVSFDAEAFSPDQFRTWVIAPRVKDNDEEDEDDVVIVGDGYELDLTEIEKSDDVNYSVLQRAVDYCANGSVAYLCVRDGVGTAFINGTTWYEVNFALNGDSLTEMYCDCPYPGLCKHLLAVAITLREMGKQDGFSLDRDFVAIDYRQFWSMVSRVKKSITL